MAAEKADIVEPQKAEETPVEVKTEPATTETNTQGDEFKKPLPPPQKEEQKPAADATDEQSKSEDSTLILSAEEEAEIAAQTNEDAVKTSPAKNAKSKKENQRNVWVSNISRSTKATDLKKLFSEKFKVDTAKIVTNGKSFFGYICLESPEMAQASVKDMNGAELIGKKVTVSLLRPDLRGSRPDTRRNRDSRRDSRATNGVKKSAAEGEKTGEDGEKKEGDGTEGDKDTDSAEKKEETVEEKLKELQRKQQKSNRVIQDLKGDLSRLNIELQNNRRRLNDATRRADTEREKKNALRRDIETMEAQLKSERRRFAQELEQMEKKRKMDEIRYQDDRSLLNKELDECRKLREYLQRKIDDVGISPRHNRSPPRRSGPGGRGVQDKMGGGRGRMHPDNRGGRSTPPPPKINNRRSRERSPFKGGKKPRMDDESFGNNHYSSGASFQGGPKPMINYSQGSSGGPPRNNMYGSTAYPEPQRYGAGYNSGGYQMGNAAPLMSRPMGYPTGGQRKY